MLANLLIGLPIMVLCLMLQTSLLVYAMRHFYNGYYVKGKVSFWSGFAAINGVMLILIIGNLGQIAIWASVFMLLDEFQQFSLAFYHSSVNFSSLGYGDIVMSEKHKLLGPLEAINGVLMIGVSTAGLMSTFQLGMKKAKAYREKNNID